MPALAYNTMRYLTDTFTLASITPTTALLQSRVALSTVDCIRVVSIIIDGSEPVGTARRFMFGINNKTYRLEGSKLVEYTGAISVDNVLSNGNTADELAALSDLSALADKNIYPIIALSAPADAVAFPSVKFSIKKLVYA